MTPFNLQTRSLCRICNNTCATGGALQHLHSCLRKQPDPPADHEPPVLVSAHGDHPAKINAYAIHILLEHQATLSDLDICLRSAWLECCTHLSLFRIRSHDYPCPEWPARAIPHHSSRSMNTPIADAISAGERATYTYDMGHHDKTIVRTHAVPAHELDDKTHLIIRQRQAPPQALSALRTLNPGHGYATVMQNLTPEVCAHCGRPATLIHENSYTCTPCSTGNPLRALVNSPRDGIRCFNRSNGPNLKLTRELLEQRRRTMNRKPA